MEELIIKLIETISRVAPEMWQILINQAIMEGFARIFWGLIFGIILGVGLKFKDDLYDLLDDWVVLIYLVLFLLSVYFISDGLMWIANPQFYSIRWLIGQVK